MANKIITTFFTQNGAPKTGLNPTIDIWELDPVNPLINTQVVTAGAYVEIGGGWYRYDFSTYDVTKDYAVTADGGVTLSAGERYHFGANESYKEEISFQTWEELLASHTTVGSAGAIVNQMGIDVTQIKIDVNTLLAWVEELLKYHKNRTKIDPIAKTLTVYDNDEFTPLKVFQLRDSSGVLSVTEVCERDPV